jgi:hypothetical protein
MSPFKIGQRQAKSPHADDWPNSKTNFALVKANLVHKLLGKAPILANLPRLFRRAGRQKAFLDDPAESQVTAGIVCFRGWIAGPNPISAVTLEIGDRSNTISTFHARADVLEATGESYAVGWRLYVYISSRAKGAPSIKIRILVAGVCLFERTLTCIGDERQQAVLEEPSGSQITAGIVCFCGLIAGPDPILVAPNLEIGDRSETISTFHERTDVLDATGASHVVGWRLYVHMSARTPGPGSIKVRILVGGVSLFERTLMCLSQSTPRRAPLFFCMHIPKTAGTSLRMALDGQPERVRAISVYPDEPFISATRCLELGPAAFDEIDVVVGHFPYGFHAISHRPYRYISLVREPFALLKSYYLYAKYEQKLPYIYKYSSIYEAAEHSSVVELDNLLTRYFSNRLDSGRVNDDDFLVAKRNIQNHFEYIGTTENMKESVDRIGGIIGTTIPLLHVNKAPEKANVEQIDENELRSRLNDKVLFDLRIYELIRNRFEA